MVIREGLEPSTQWLKALKGCFLEFSQLHFASFHSAFFTFQLIIVSLSFAVFGTLGTQVAHKKYALLQIKRTFNICSFIENMCVNHSCF